MSTLTELATILTAAHVAVLGTSLFLSDEAQIPAGDGPGGLGILSITMTGGSGPENTHNAQRFGALPAYQRPAAQLIARHSRYSVAEALAYAAYAALFAVQNTFVNGVWWRDVTLLQEPSEVLGPDAIGRAQASFNIAMVKRPTAALSS
jgi:hypothetical protein